MTGRVIKVLRELALTGGAVVGTLCLVVALLGVTVGVRPLVFTSGSMAPTIDTGDLAFTRPVEVGRLVPGDVVSVLDPRGVRVTHRVVAVDAAAHLLRLRGDANRVADPLPYAADRVDLVLFAVPAGGYVLTWLSGPTATLLLGAYALFLLGVLRPRGRVGAGAAAAGLVLALGLATGGRAPEPTLAAWTDPAPITGTTLAAYTVPKPAITDCAAAIGAVTVTWTAVTSPYALTYKAVVVETGATLTVSGTGSTRSARYTTTGTTGGTTQTIQITAAPPSTASWTSVPANQTVKIAVAGYLPSCGTAS